MICLYCEDISKRSDYQHFYRDHGILTDAPPTADFIQRTNSDTVVAALFIGDFDYFLTEQIRKDIPVFIAGSCTRKNDYLSGDCFVFPLYDDPALISSLTAICGDENEFSYRNLLFSHKGKTYYLGYEFDLTPTERSVVGYLVKNSDRFVSAEEILRYCIGDEYRRRGNVSQHISQINKKSVESGGRPMIETDLAGNYHLCKYF